MNRRQLLLAAIVTPMAASLPATEPVGIKTGSMTLQEFSREMLLHEHKLRTNAAYRYHFDKLTAERHGKICKCLETFTRTVIEQSKRLESSYGIRTTPRDHCQLVPV